LNFTCFAFSLRWNCGGQKPPKGVIMAEVVKVERRGRVAEIRMMRPGQMNTLDEALADALPAALAAVAQDDAIRAVILGGEGRTFMAGGDLSRFHADLGDAPAMARRLLDGFHAAIRSIATMSKPVIAAVQGPVAGGGVGLAFACDLVVAASDATFLSAYTKLGTSPDGGTTWTMTRILGAKRALAFMLLNDRMSAEEARQLGLINLIVPASELASAADNLACRIAAGSVGATASVKRLVGLAATGALDAQLDAERSAFASAAGTADFREGITAFFERRSPRFPD
jgi:2-(1,2-epoxy-1,2-dihydrophenyl)acetyl-CoA isomerase